MDIGSRLSPVFRLANECVERGDHPGSEVEQRREGRRQSKGEGLFAGIVTRTFLTGLSVTIVTFVAYESARRILLSCSWLAGNGVLRSSVTSLRSTI